MRQLEGRIGADSAASYVELGQRASRHTHCVELHRWPASSRTVAVPSRLQDTHPTAHRLVPCRLTHRSCCRRYAYTVECRGPRHAYMHAHPWQGLRAAHCCLQHSRCSCCGRPIFLNFVTFSTKHGWTSDKVLFSSIGVMLCKHQRTSPTVKPFLSFCGRNFEHIRLYTRRHHFRQLPSCSTV